MKSDGLIVVNKPLGVTSRAAVDRAARWFPRRTPLGHAGTLDPLASGVLVILAGRATRLMEYVQELGKEYVADVTFGATSRTGDAEGPIVPDERHQVVDRGPIEAALRSFNGVVEQTPPAFSAAKIEGRRAHTLARAGKEVTIKPRPVRIDSIDIVEYEPPRLRIVVKCGKGTYIRSLAVDLGHRLGVGAYLSGLQRTAIGGFRIDDAVDLGTEISPERIQPMLAAVRHWPTRRLDDGQLQKLRQGQAVPAGDGAGELLAIVDGNNELAAVVRLEGGLLRPVKVVMS